jgi:hypothetical protein
MTKLRKAAQGMQCMIRLPGVCNHNSETTVLAHINMSGISGRGLKAPDLLGAWACSNCHHVHTTLEWEGTHFDRDYIQLAFLEGVIRTQYCLIKKGIVKA